MTTPMSNVPIPDPTLLTAEALDRLRAEMSDQIAQVEKMLLSQIRCEREALDAAKELLAERIEGHWRLDIERFAASAVAITKSEDATTGTLVKMDAVSSASRAALSDRIDAMKDMVNSLERSLTGRINDVANVANGTVQRRDGGQQASTTLIAMVVMIIALVGLGVTIIAKLP